jgi:hypothetical protein
LVESRSAESGEKHLGFHLTNQHLHRFHQRRRTLEGDACRHRRISPSETRTIQENDVTRRRRPDVRIAGEQARFANQRRRAGVQGVHGGDIFPTVRVVGEEHEKTRRIAPQFGGYRRTRHTIPDYHDSYSSHGLIRRRLHIELSGTDEINKCILLVHPDANTVQLRWQPAVDDIIRAPDPRRRRQILPHDRHPGTRDDTGVKAGSVNDTSFADNRNLLECNGPGVPQMGRQVKE